MHRNLFATGVSLCASLFFSATTATARVWMQDEDWSSLQRAINLAASGDTIACIGEPIDEGDITFPAKSLLIQSISDPTMIIGQMVFDTEAHVTVRHMNHHGTSTILPLADVEFEDVWNKDFFGGLNAGLYEVNEVFGNVKYIDCVVDFPLYVHSVPDVDYGTATLTKTSVHTSRLNWPAIRLEANATMWMYESVVDVAMGNGVEVNGSSLFMQDCTVRAPKGDAIHAVWSGVNLFRSNLTGVHGLACINATCWTDNVTITGMESAINVESGKLDLTGCVLNAETNGAVLTGEIGLWIEMVRFNTQYGFWCDAASGTIGVGRQADYGFEAVRNPESGDCDLEFRLIP